MTSNLQKAVQRAAQRLEDAARADGRNFENTELGTRKEPGDPAYKDPYVDGSNMLHNAAFLIEKEEELIVELAKEILSGVDMLSEERIKELQGMIEVYS